MLVFVEKVAADQAIHRAAQVSLTISMTADERTKTRRLVQTDDGQGVYLRLPRGTVLYHHDLLQSEQDVASPSRAIARIIARSEPVITVRSHKPYDLLRAAYHLGNRHVALELSPDYLRLSPDPVLHQMLVQMGLQVLEEEAPFVPEMGAYGHYHDHTHAHDDEPDALESYPELTAHDH